MARNLVRLLVAATVAFGGAIMSATPALAETCVNAMPLDATDVRGYTFEGEVLSIILGPEIETGMPRLSDVRIAVSKVHANPADRPKEDPIRAGEIIEIHSNACDGFASVGVAVGSRVLISTRNRYSAATWDTAVWERQGPTLRLLVLMGLLGEVWLTGDRRLADVRTVHDALVLVAPESVGVPDTSTDAHRPFAGGLGLGLVAGAVTLALGILQAGSRRSVRSERSQETRRA